MHLKRQKAPKKWPVARKGEVFIVRPRFNLEKGIPILVVLRDVLGIAKNRKEVKKTIYEKNILINKKPLKDEKYGAFLFDVITIVPSKKDYRLELSENGKFKINEIKEQESKGKISKVIGKKILKGRKTQLNLIDGRNFLSNIKCNINDSILINFKDGKGEKIEKCLALKEKSKAIVFDGKHAGKSGTINKINREKKTVELTSDNEKFNALIKQVMVFE